jgi:hypothetical protein
MDSKQFVRWAAASGIHFDLAEQIARHAPEHDEYIHLYTLGQISRCFSEPPFDIQSPEKSGFVVVGSCMNGDQIVINTRDDYGAVYYLNHESVQSQSYKLAKVAQTLDAFIGLANAGEDPIDYHAALKLDR